MKKKMFFVGGGHAHALVLHQLITQPIAELELFVIDPEEKAPYTGMLPGHVAGHYSRDELYIDIKSLAKAAGATYIQSRVTAVKPEKSILVLENKETCQYDMASLDIGIHARDTTVPGLSEYAVPVKPLGIFADAWEQFLESSVENPKIAVIGGGVAAVEMALAMKYFLRESSPECTLITRGHLLKQVGNTTKKFLRAELKRSGVQVLENASISAIKSDRVCLQNGEEVRADFILSALGARPYGWLKDTGLNLTDGYIEINDHLQSTSHKNVFAVGDCAHFESDPLQKAGVYAVRQAPYLYKNMAALAQGKEMQVFRPQKDYLKLITLGRKSACADKFGICMRGPHLWQLKRFIDWDFMKRFDPKPLSRP